MSPSMGWATGIAIYVTIWWVVIFAVLPWGARPPERIERGHASSAPATPRLGIKVLATTVVSTIIWLALDLAVRFEVMSFRDLAAP
jgi:predicted secreted protein